MELKTFASMLNNHRLSSTEFSIAPSSFLSVACITVRSQVAYAVMQVTDKHLFAQTSPELPKYRLGKCFSCAAQLTLGEGGPEKDIIVTLEQNSYFSQVSQNNV